MVLDLSGLLRTLDDAGARFVVIGAITVAAHAFVRATEDVDIVPEPSSTNLDGLCNALVRLDARLVREPSRGIDADVRSQLYRGQNLTVTTTLGDLDVVQRLPGVPDYPELERDSWEAELSGVRFRVCSRAHLIAMKRARGSAIDLADIEHLSDV